LNFDFYYIIICTTFIFDGIIPPQLSRINQKKKIVNNSNSNF
jgi:hypothetical protein